MLTRQQTVEKPNQKPFTAWRRLAAWRQEYQGRTGKAPAGRGQVAKHISLGWRRPPNPHRHLPSHKEGDRKKNVPPSDFCVGLCEFLLCLSQRLFVVPSRLPTHSHSLHPTPQCISQSRHTSPPPNSSFPLLLARSRVRPLLNSTCCPSIYPLNQLLPWSVLLACLLLLL